MELLDRLKAATTPDRGLDWEIHCRNGLDGVGAYGSHPKYTESLDAALTLIPDEYSWHLNQWGLVQLFHKHDSYRGILVSDAERLPALGLCIAGVRAQSIAAGQ